MKEGRVTIPVMELEFNQPGNTIWIHGKGGTVLRIKATGKIIIDACNPGMVGSHGDLVVEGDIKICLAEDANMESLGHGLE